MLKQSARPESSGIATLHGLIEEQVARRPEAVALRFSDVSLSFAQLDAQANRCAHYLRELGVGPDVIVGVLMERSLEMVVALLAILKAGGAYLPLDTHNPPARLAFVLTDADVAVVLTQQRFKDRLSNMKPVALALDTEAADLSAYPCTSIEAAAAPSDLAYVIYTSGSTGQPKGCLLTHEAIHNRLEWMQRAYRMGDGDRVLQKTPYTFDVSVWEFFWPLRAGATLVVAAPQGHKDTHYLVDIMRRERITVCHFVPSMLRFFLSDPDAASCTTLRHVFASGEALPFEVVERFMQVLPGAQLHNLYGPTEAAVDVSYWQAELRADQLVPIGKPIDNIVLRVLDVQQRMVPVGQEGELYIGGIGLARGYLNRPELTTQRFVPDPHGLPEERLYRTGDRVRQLPDGNIVFLGRMDFQVKLRGLRIELGEIEAALRRHAGVKEAAVLVRGEDEGDPKLVAYLEAQAGVRIEAKEMRKFVGEQLPDYMVPSLVVAMPALPVTTHGKLDRDALPWPVEVPAGMSSQPVPAPPQPAESRPVASAGTGQDAVGVIDRVRRHVLAVLKHDAVGIDDDLFDLGATSLTLVRVAALVRDDLQIVVPVDVFLDAPTVRSISDFVSRQISSVPAAPESVAVAAATARAAATQALGTLDLDAIERRITSHVCAALKLNAVDAEGDLFDLGATSLTLLRLVERIRQDEGISVPVDVFLDTPSVRRIARYVAGVAGTSPATPEAACATNRDAAVTLVKARIRSTAALPQPGDFAQCSISFETFSQTLALYAAQPGSLHRLYPSGGGMHAVRAYVAVREGGVHGLAAGLYYHQPESHALWRVGDLASLSPGAWAPQAQRTVAQAAFMLVFVAALDAIAPVYQRLSIPLVTLEAGYMGQLLLGRQSGLGLRVQVALPGDADALARAFDLCDTERVVHALCVGGAGIGDVAPAHRAAWLTEAPAPQGIHALRHLGNDPAIDGASLTPVAVDALHQEHRYLRAFSHDAQPLPLRTASFDTDAHRLRASRREYDMRPVPLEDLGRFLTLCRPARASGLHLHGGADAMQGWQFHLFVRHGRVTGLEEGLYRYDAQAHTLLLIHALSAAQLEQAYTPFNRRHAKKAAFCLFLFAPHLAADEAVIHHRLLAAGYLGQLLMERQAEFGLGLCPIGGVRVQALGLGDELELLHSFTGGAYAQPLSPGHERIEEDKPASRYAAPVRSVNAREPLAIIGLSGRYPGAQSVDVFWQALRDGASHIAEATAHRQSLMVRHPGADKTRLGCGGYLDDIDCFDSLLFGISPREARGLDPQERLLLESAWACLEDAGYTAASLRAQRGKVGVFIGAMWNDYQSQGVQAWEEGAPLQEASHHASLANRISYVFDFSGPSVAINTSCSSGMTALHFACESLRRGECDAALVGGVNLVSHAYHAHLLQGIDFLSKDGVARPFSTEAAGWVLGEGVGVMLLKRKSDAECDDDSMHAVIRGTAIAHAGRTMRFGAPSAQQQSQGMRDALSDAGLSPSDVDYVEAAAAGASLADATEFSAIRSVFEGRDPQRPCRVGSVKANIGHLESASALSQIAKVVCQLRHGEFAPSLNTRPYNPLLALDGSGLEIVDQRLAWQSRGAPRRALVNAVGATGSSGHAVLEERSSLPARPVPVASIHVLPLSASTGEQLAQHAQRLHAFLMQHDAARIDDIAFTLQTGRVSLVERLAIVVSDTASLRDSLAAWMAGEVIQGIHYRGRARVDAPEPSSSSAQALAAAWVCGATINWRPPQGARRLSLPSYPFERVRHWIAPHAAPSGSAGPLSVQAPGAGNDEVRLREKTLSHLIGIVAQVTEIPRERVDSDESLQALGLSSLMVLTLTERLEAIAGSLPKTLFFESRTLRDAAERLLAHGEVALRQHFGLIHAESAQAPTPAPTSKLPAAKHAANGHDDDVAIIGQAGRYPKARTLAEYWNNLVRGVDCITEIPSERWDNSRYFDPKKGKRGKIYSRWGGFLDGVDEFDPLLFNIAPLHAKHIDPQERLFLQVAWHVLEDAGYSRETLRRQKRQRIGVFVGVMYSEYQLLPSLQTGLGVTTSYGTIANRVSHTLDLRGPSMAIDTMCSSSLTAIHLACDSIRRGECEAAIAGGVNLSLHPAKYATHALMSMAATDGRCRSFGEGGDGFVPGEGVGAVLLKPLSRALEDGDHVYGVIKASAIGHGGHTNGFTVPDPDAQAEVVAQAIQGARVHPRAISYIEAHGTGTSLGDPIEIAGLNKAFGDYTQDRQYCAIGSAKSNIGHCESAAGVAGLAKVLLQMQHRTLVKSLHSEQLNPHIDFKKTPFTVQQTVAEWKRPVIDGCEQPRTAGISSFGAGGSNAHVIVQEYVDPRVRPPRGEGPVVILLSAKSDEQLKEQATQLLEALAHMTDAQLDDMAYTLQVGREAMELRLACAVGSVAQLKDTLHAFIDGRPCAELQHGDVRQGKEVLALFGCDTVLTEVVARWVSDKQLDQLAGVWVKGVDVDWGRLPAARAPRRIGLPGYPFARERHWVPVNPTVSPQVIEKPTQADSMALYEELLVKIEKGVLTAEAAAQEARCTRIKE